jgi:2-C-methyl-D-erythritol 4-phosphate cytidylyltransferase
MNDVWVLIPAGGVGVRAGLGYPKQLAPCGDRTLIEWTVRAFEGLPTVVAAPVDYLDLFRQTLTDKARVVPGGPTRHDSVRAAFAAVRAEMGDGDLVIVHDGARPFFDRRTLPEACARARLHGAVSYGFRAVDTLKRVDRDGRVVATLDRRDVWHALSPQIFRVGVLERAHAAHRPRPDDPEIRDDASLVEVLGEPVQIFESSARNFKITHPGDLALLKLISEAVGQPRG